MATPPPKLRDLVAADLKPMRPLAPPWRRTALVAPVAAAIVAGVPLLHHFRIDYAIVGFGRAWLLSIAQSAAGVWLVSLALRESVPGRQIPRSTLRVAVLAGVLVPAVVLAITSRVSFLGSAPGHWWIESYVCFRVSALAAAPALLVSAGLAARAYPLRPAIAGALYGLGSGLIADAGLRLYCEYSAPGHVVIAHGGAILASTIVGILVATVAERRRA